MTIKRLSKENTVKMRDLWAYCFGVNEPSNDQEWNDYLYFLDLDSCLGYFSDNELTSTYIVLPYKMFIRGELMKMGGIAAVATYPQHRRRKQITALLKESLRIMRANKQFISVLYPFKYSFYRKYGYENCTELLSITFPPQNVLNPKDFQPLRIREITQEESFELLKPFRKKIGPRYNLIMYEDQRIWKSQYLNKKHKIFTIRDEQNEIVGYFITYLKKGNDEWDVRLMFRDILVSTHKARLTVFDYIKKHLDQIKEVNIPLMGDELVTNYFDDLWEGSFKYKTTGGAMFRIIDIEEAINQLIFDKELAIEFTLQVKDDYAPWNEKPLKIKIRNGKTTIQKTDEKTIDLMTEIKAFTQLFTGYRDIFQLRELNKVNVSDEKIAEINEAFPKRITSVRAFF
jgi:predicted acetyltransferase